MAECIFCKIIDGKAPASLVFADELCVAFLDIHPLNPGHLLVVPRLHAPALADLPVGTGGRLFQVAQKLAAALRQSGLRCEGINLFLADGAAAGQEVFHLHLHVLPRFAGDGFGFKRSPGTAPQPERSILDAYAQDIRQHLMGS